MARITALTEFARLESTGTYRESEETPPREVTLSFGEATLVIGDGAGRPITHWSLPAVRRLNGSEMPARYAPDGTGPELLEIEDATMVEALTRVARSIASDQPRPGRLRLILRAGTVAVLVGAVGLWLPGALTAQALRALPAAKRTEIGATILGHLQRLTGPSCREPLGTAALAELQRRVLGTDHAGQIVVLPGQLPEPLLLPGEIVVLAQERIEQAAEPAIIAGDVVAAALAAPERDPLAPVLSEAGLMATLRLMATGDLPQESLAATAARLLSGAEVTRDPAALAAAFGLAGVPLTPWAASLGLTEAEAKGLADLDPLKGTSATLILADDAWVALQGICGV